MKTNKKKHKKQVESIKNKAYAPMVRYCFNLSSS